MSVKQLLRADIARGISSEQKVDREFVHSKGKGAIFGYAVLNKGKLNDGDVRDWEIDDTALDQVIDLSNQAKIGVKSRFGHPNMSNTALGTFLGRAKNFRKDGDIVRADLYIDETAYKTPDGDLATYVLDLAESDPAAFGSSLVFDAELEYRLEKDGTRAKDSQTGEPLPALVRYKKLFASDIVDDPAATKGLFGKFFNEDVKPSAEMTTFLNKFLSTPDAVEKTINFLQRYQRNGLDEEEINNKEEVKIMELKDLTLEALKKEKPDFVEVLHTEGLEGGKEQVISDTLKLERARVASILEKSAVYEKVEDIVKESISAGDSLEVTEGKFKARKLDLLEKNAPPSPGPGTEQPEKGSLSLEEQCKQEFAKDQKLREEFKTEEAYFHFKKAEASGKVKILKKG